MKGKLRPIEKVIIAGMVLITGFIVTPMVGNFFDQARRNKCLNNLREIGQALRIYWDDYRLQYPPFVDDHGGRYYSGGPTALAPYLGSNQSLRCPSDRHPLSIPGYSSYNAWDSDGDGNPETPTYNAFGWWENGGAVDRPDGWPSAATEGVPAELQQAWERIGYRYFQQPYLANGNAPPNTIALVCLRHSRREEEPIVLILRVSGKTEVARLKEVDFISQLGRTPEKAGEEGKREP